MNELQQVLNEIKTDKIENLKPENLREGVSLLGVDGSFTSDANALSKDLLSGKTAYVGGNKIEGSIISSTKPLGITCLKVNSTIPDCDIIAYNDDGMGVRIIDSSEVEIYQFDFEHSLNNLIGTVSGVNFTVSDTISITDCYQTDTGWCLLIATSQRQGRMSGTNNYVYIYTLVYNKVTDTFSVNFKTNTTIETYMCAPKFHKNLNGDYFLLIPTCKDSSRGYSDTYFGLVVYSVDFDPYSLSLSITNVYNNSSLSGEQEYHLTMTKYIGSCQVSNLDDGSHLISITYRTTWTSYPWFSLVCYANQGFTTFSNVRTLQSSNYSVVYKDLLIDITSGLFSTDLSNLTFTIYKYYNSNYNGLKTTTLDLSAYYGDTDPYKFVLNVADNMIILKIILKEGSNDCVFCSFIIENEDVKLGIAWTDTYSNSSTYITNCESSNTIVPFIASSDCLLFQLKTDGVIIESLNDGDYTYYNTYNANDSSNSILEDSIFYGINGKIEGTMPNNGDVTITPTLEEQTKEQGYYNSLTIEPVTSEIDTNIKPENIKKRSNYIRGYRYL